MIGDLCDLLLQDKSPRVVSDRVKMGDSTDAHFGPLVRLLSHLVTSSKTETMDDQAFDTLSAKF